MSALLLPRRWLRAALYQTDFRPVPLVQWLKVGRGLRDESGEVVRELAPPDAAWEKKVSACGLFSTPAPS